jgi:hypothetical protein
LYRTFFFLPIRKTELTLPGVEALKRRFVALLKPIPGGYAPAHIPPLFACHENQHEKNTLIESRRATKPLAIKATETTNCSSEVHEM